MLKIALPHPKQSLDAANAAGGFVWWYADLRGASGEGVVLIWSLGLPFLPDARNGVAAVTRPAVSIAHYINGQQRLYLLQDYEQGDADLDVSTGSGRIGASQYEVSMEGDQVVLEVFIDEPLPSSTDRLRGHLKLEGPRTRIPDSDLINTAPLHLWVPQTLSATGRAVLRYGDHEHRIEGSAYFDSNVSDTPLHEQGIRSWRWGRISFTSTTLVYYEVEEPQGVQRYLYHQAPTGPMERVPGRLGFSAEKRGIYGLRTPHEIIVASASTSVWAKTETLVEDGPFYSRALLVATNEHGETGRGYSEVVVPENIDRPWQRPLVRMRTHQIGRSNSRFLPLFNGPREGRTGRVLSSFWGRQMSA